jgi:hypothetical protein
MVEALCFVAIQATCDYSLVYNRGFVKNIESMNGSLPSELDIFLWQRNDKDNSPYMELSLLFGLLSVC